MALALAFAPNGDVLAAGALENRDAWVDFSVVRLAPTTGAEQWRYETNGASTFFDAGDDIARAVTTDAAGDVVAAGHIQRPGTEEDFAVVKLDGSTGAERWRAVVAGTQPDGRDVASSVAVDAAGDVVATGFLVDTYGPTYLPDLFVMKLAGDTGGEVWRRTVGLPLADAAAVHVDGGGDVVVAGDAGHLGGVRDLVVTKLDAATGATLWETWIDGGAMAYDHATAMVLRPDGDALVAGSVGGDAIVARISGATGAEVWRWTLGGAFGGYDEAHDVAVDADGNVLAGVVVKTADEGWDVHVVRLDGDSGVESWRRTPATFACLVQPSVAVAAAADGDALFTTAVVVGPDDRDVVVTRLAASDGAERWRRQLGGDAPGEELPTAIREHPANGSVVVTAKTMHAASGPDFTVLALDGATGADF
jgi:hypothetical protein